VLEKKKREVFLNDFAEQFMLQREDLASDKIFLKSKLAKGKCKVLS